MYVYDRRMVLYGVLKGSGVNAISSVIKKLNQYTHTHTAG